MRVYNRDLIFKVVCGSLGPAASKTKAAVFISVSSESCHWSVGIYRWAGGWDCRGAERVSAAHFAPRQRKWPSGTTSMEAVSSDKGSHVGIRISAYALKGPQGCAWRAGMLLCKELQKIVRYVFPLEANGNRSCLLAHPAWKLWVVTWPCV